MEAVPTTRPIIGIIGNRYLRANTKDTMLAGIGEKYVLAIEAAGGKALFQSADAGDRDSLLAARTAIEQTCGGPATVLINAAGGNRPDANATPTQSFFDLSAEALRGAVDLNLLGTVLPSQVFGRVMAERKAGSIINISSMAASRPLTRVVAYAASKAAVDNFTRWLATYMAQECGPAIRVNAIAPGFFIGEQNRSFLLNEDGTLTARGQTIIDHTPAGRFGEPDELISTLIWLCSPGASFVNGIVVPVDGGFSAFSGV